MENVSRGILLIDDHYILIKRTNKPNSKYKCFYCLPGGHLEENETFEEACKREVYEELGVKVNISKLVFELNNEKLNKNERFYEVTFVSGKLGTGKGEEFTNREVSKYGIYEIVKVHKSKINDILLLPEEVKNILRTL